MSCCIVKKDTTSSVEELNKLGKYFDEVVLEKKEKYQLLTLRDKTTKLNYNYIVWLEVKVSYSKKEKHNTRTDEDILKKVCKSILCWIDALKNFDKSNVGKQLSLFEEENSELEKEPEMPGAGEDKSLNSYYKKRDEVRKRNLLKQYGFFDLLSIDYYTYSGIDYREQLPNISEVRELYKQAILKGMNNPGRYDDFWFDTPSYLNKDGALSDIELKNRISRTIRLFLLPYKSFKKGFADNSYTWHPYNREIDYRYYLDGTKLTAWSSQDYDKLDLPSYDGVFNNELLEWVRQTMGIEKAEAISDDDILRKNIKSFMSRLIGYDAFKKYDFDKKINTFKDWKQFKASIKALVPDGNNGGGSGYSLDGFSGSISIDRKGEIEITQNIKERIELGRNVDDLEIDKFNEDHVVVFNLIGDDIYKKAFELFSKKSIKQQSLFDFLTA